MSRVAGALAVLLLLSAAPASAQIIDAATAQRQAAAGALTIVDVRRPSEWAATGLPHDAQAVSMHTQLGLPGFLAEIARLTGGDKDKPLALICASGVRSSFIATTLRANGYTHISDIGEGMFGSAAGPGWLARRLPLRPCREC